MNRGRFILLRGLFLSFFFCLSVIALKAQPTNDNCANATVIPIPANGYGLGTFNSANADLTRATIQTNEFFVVPFVQSGLTQKSAWYRFTLPVTRSVRVTLIQPGSAIQAGDVGFAVYKTNTCLPTSAQISTTLTAIPQFGSTENRCTEAGDYLIQVASRNSANGQVYIRLDVSDSTQAPYDKPQQAFNFGVLNRANTCAEYDMECQSVENENEICQALPDARMFNKSTWHTFTTPASFEYIGVYLFSQVPSPVPNVDFGYTLYEGDARSTPINGLVPVDPCRSFRRNNGNLAVAGYDCSRLKPNTTYSVQVFAHQNFRGRISVGLTMSNRGPSTGGSPILSQLGAGNRLGNIMPTPAGVTLTLADRFGCNSRFSNNPNCALTPAGGTRFINSVYNLGVYFTFTLTRTASIEIQPSGFPMRLFAGGLTENCSSPSNANLLAESNWILSQTCLPPGDYTLQILGNGDFNDQLGGNYCQGTTAVQVFRNLGATIQTTMRVREINAITRFSLSTSGAIDVINGINGRPAPLQVGVDYRGQPDTIGCSNTVLPASFNCPPPSAGNFTKAIYRQFSVSDSGHLQVFTPNGSGYGFMIFQGNADSIAQAQNIRNFPGRLQNMIPVNNCTISSANIPTVCLLPGTYTQMTAVVDQPNLIGTPVQATFRFNAARSVHHSGETAQDMGDIVPAGQVASDGDVFSCADNAVPIAGLAPCPINGKPATKAIYRQFYLSQPRRLNIRGYSDRFDDPSYSIGYGGVMRLFYGRATDGLNTLRPVGGSWDCFERNFSATCEVFPAGWYTVVAYGAGPTASQPMKDLNTIVSGNSRYSGYVGVVSRFRITASAGCTPPSFNRPHKASVDQATGRPYVVDFGPNPGSTDVTPRFDRTVNLQREFFDCSQDTAFLRRSMRSCDSTVNRVAFYVFSVARESYLEVTLQNGAWGAIYPFDVRTDSARLLTDQPIQACQKTPTRLQICRIQPGTYTLVIQVGSNFQCDALTPSLYIDQIGTSRFDHARNAYDFGVVEADGTFKSGRRGDVNPLNPARTPSNDFIYCTTGAQETDPLTNSCAYFGMVNPKIYANTVNNALFEGNINGDQGTPRRNLWYTFVADKPGTVNIRVRNLMSGKNPTAGFGMFVYKSDADASLTYAQLLAQGMADSTVEQGLTYVTNNITPFWCNPADQLSFYRDPCDHKPERYYIVVYSDMRPVAKQLDISIRIDSVAFTPVKFDKFTQANNLGNIGAGTHRGATDNVTCATSSPNEVFGWSPCQKSLWYKFTTTMSGNIRYRIRIPNQPAGRAYEGDYNIRLLRQLRENDSTTTGLQFIRATSSIRTGDNPNAWSVTCLAPGTYYIYLSGCDLSTQNIYPEIEIIPSQGDFCLNPVAASLNGAGTTAVTALVDCHTIGTDYGEFNPTLSCPPGAQTSRYKSTWFRIDIGGRDTLDLTVFLNENTNASAADIQYRMMTGSCGAMQEQSCVQNALTRNTYRCLAPGSSYYIQVFTPADVFGTSVTGTVELNMISARKSDTCQPSNSCLANASFQPVFDCTVSDAVRFSNTSTFGTDIRYYWDFGYQGNQSTAVSPSFRYPALALAQTYRVRLIVENVSCGRRDTSFQTITVPGRPSVSLGADTLICTPGSTLRLDATSFPGATYQWSNGFGTPAVNVNASGLYWVRVTYNGCVARDSINVFINPNRKNPIDYRALCTVDSIQLSKFGATGTSYNWSNGQTTNSIFARTPGIYWVDLTLNGCTTRDTIIVAGRENLNPLGNDMRVCQASMPVTLNATVNGATSYQWQDNSRQSSLTARQPGLYWVQITLGGCTYRDSISIAVDSVQTGTVNASICAGENFRAPSGRIFSQTGTYQDTLRNVRGCDSLITRVGLSVSTLTRQSFERAICAGSELVLPSGRRVSTAGTYLDTLRNTRGCDSLITTTLVTVAAVQRSNLAASICAGRTFLTPSGRRTLAVAGTYTDTLRYSAGCDSIIYTITLSVQNMQTRSIPVSICNGATYRMPTGRVISIAGVYRDTLRSQLGCDSLETVVNLQVNTPQRVSGLASICQGSSYRLPSGRFVNSQGVYVDTVKSISGCDSLISQITLQVIFPVRENQSASICPNQVFTLPSGRRVGAAGRYLDTVRNQLGCDSLITTLDLSVNTVTTTTITRNLCAGQTYQRPGGELVSISGTYIDTVRSNSGCDSIVTSIIQVSPPLSVVLSGQTTLCIGQETTLIATPSGGVGQNYSLRWIGVAASGNTVRLQPETNTRVVVEVTDGCTVMPARDTINITVVPLPSARFTLASKRVCAPITLSLRTDIAPPDGSVLKWNFGTGSAADTSRDVNAGFTYRQPGTYIIRLSVTNIAGCIDTYQDTLTVFNNPTPRIQALNSICLGSTVAFTDAGNGSATDTWRWNFGNGQTATGQTPAPVQFTRAGRYTVQLTRSNVGGCAVTTEHRIVVDQLQVQAQASRTTFCDTGTVNFTTIVRSFSADSLGDPVQYRWEFGDGSTSSLSNPSHHYARTGNYRAILTVRSAYGCIASDTINIESISQPRVRIEGPAEICAGTIAQFSGVSELGNIQQWRWQLGPGQNAEGQQPAAVRFQTAGTYSIRLIAESGSACADTVIQNLVVQANPVIQFAQQSLDICRGDRVTLQASGGVQYEWTPQAGLSDTRVANPVASPTVTTQYQVRVTSAFGCSSTDTVRVNVSQPFTVTVSPEQNLCAGERVTLSASGAVRYQWLPAQGLNNASIANPVASPTASTTFQVVGFGTDNCFTDTAEVRVNVIPLPTVFAGNDTTVGVAQPLQLRPIVSADVRSYTWSPSTFLSCTNCPVPTATPTSPIQYRISVANAFGCTASDDISITVRCSADDVFIPNTFTPNGDGANDIFYPRGRGIRTVEFFRIYNRWGEMVYERKGFALNDRSAGWDGIYKGERLASGVFVYTTRMICENNEVIDLKGSIMIVR